MRNIESQLEDTDFTMEMNQVRLITFRLCTTVIGDGNPKPPSSSQIGLYKSLQRLCKRFKLFEQHVGEREELKDMNVHETYWNVVGILCR